MNEDRNITQINSLNSYSREVSVQDLEQGILNTARLVRRYGTIYWPLVERLQKEIDIIEKRESLLSKLLGEDPKASDQANFG